MKNTGLMCMQKSRVCCVQGITVMYPRSKVPLYIKASYNPG